MTDTEEGMRFTAGENEKFFDQMNTDSDQKGKSRVSLAQRYSSMRHTALVGEHGLTTFTGVLAIISTIIGGGIVSIPYSFVSFGIPIAIVFNIVAVIMTTVSVHIYLWAKDAIPDKPQSLFEIGYFVIERKAIFLVSVIQFILGFGLMLVYFIVFADTAGQLFANLFNEGVIDKWCYERYFYVLILGVAMTPVILKKELAELEWLSLVLFGSLGLFVILMTWLLCFDQSFGLVAGGGLSEEVYKPNHGIGRIVGAVSVTFVAYGYQQNVYPIYGSLKDKTNETYLTVNGYGLILTCAVYIAVGLLTIAMFGVNTQSVLLDNIGTVVRENGKHFWEGYVIQLSFMILLACHIPFIFFSGKEGMLIIIDEIDRKSISSALWHKLYAAGGTFEQENKDKMPANPELPIPGDDTPFMDKPALQASAEIRETTRASQLMSAKDRLTMMTVEESNRLAYKDMKQSYYYGSVLICWAFVLLLSIVIESVTIVFDFASAFAITAIAFIFPAMFYLKAVERFGGGTPIRRFTCYLFYGLGGLNCILGLSSTILNIMGGE